VVRFFLPISAPKLCFFCSLCRLIAENSADLYYFCSQCHLIPPQTAISAPIPTFLGANCGEARGRVAVYIASQQYGA
jgi:hypothetical protein